MYTCIQIYLYRLEMFKFVNKFIKCITSIENLNSPISCKYYV